MEQCQTIVPAISAMVICFFGSMGIMVTLISLNPGAWWSGRAMDTLVMAATYVAGIVVGYYWVTPLACEG